MSRLIWIFIFFCSCQGGMSRLSNWWGGWKDYTVTYLASESANSYLSEDEKNDLLDLFEDLQIADKCRKRQELIENNKTLKALGRYYELPRGFLFDVLFSYDYEKAIRKLGGTTEERVALTVVNSWKTIATIPQINQMVEEISKCYPKEYVD